MTVLMFITYHHNFCSHHGHHLCRGKIGDMMAFPLSQLRAQSSPTSPSSVCTPGCTTMVEMSHTRNELVFVVRDQWTDDSAGLTGELADEWRHLLHVTNYREFGTLSPWPDRREKTIKPAEFWISNWCTEPITTIFQCVRTWDPLTDVHVLHHSEYL